jgi:hypothetical protein
MQVDVSLILQRNHSAMRDAIGWKYCCLGCHHPRGIGAMLPIDGTAIELPSTAVIQSDRFPMYANVLPIA